VPVTRCFVSALGAIMLVLGSDHSDCTVRSTCAATVATLVRSALHLAQWTPSDIVFRVAVHCVLLTLYALALLTRLLQRSAQRNAPLVFRFWCVRSLAGTGCAQQFFAKLGSLRVLLADALTLDLPVHYISPLQPSPGTTCAMALSRMTAAQQVRASGH
jgi:hypothetical protein